MKCKIFKNPEGFDHNNIEFIGENYKGVGYISKENNSIGLERCPMCGKENYAMSVSSGICAWCKFNAHDIWK